MPDFQVIDLFTLLGVRIGKEGSKIAKLTLRIDFESLCSDALGQKPGHSPPLMRSVTNSPAPPEDSPKR